MTGVIYNHMETKSDPRNLRASRTKVHNPNTPFIKYILYIVRCIDVRYTGIHLENALDNCPCARQQTHTTLLKKRYSNRTLMSNK